ncbi:MAG TPA: hypothetical protein VIM61_15960 [Chthoniobacterales bacterium]
MSMIYRSDVLTVFHDARGFVEWVVREHRQISKTEIDEVAAILEKCGVTRLRALVNRVNDYATPDDYLFYDLHEIGSVTTERVAFFAPSPMDQNRSHAVAITALHAVPTRVFAARQPAIDWLLSDEPA